MERKIMNLGRAKKKLRYFQPEESTPFNLKIKDVFSVRDLDNIFDDLDSDPGTPLLSPLPKSPGEDEQNKGSQSLVPKSPLCFRGKISPLKPSDVLEAADDIQMDHLNDKGSPFEEIAPIKTSSPIELLVDGVTADAEKPETSPLLFGIEDDEPVVGDLNKPQMSQGAESVKDGSQGDSESLVSPPSRLEFVKPTKQNDPVTSSTPLKAPEQVCKISAPEPEEESQTDGRITLSPVVLIQNLLPKPLPEEQPNQQVQEVGLKQSLFQKKLKNALQPRASCFRKQEDLQQQAHASSPHVQEEDFMILEDDVPIRFTIPRKTENKENPAPETRSARRSCSKDTAFPKPSKEAETHKDEPKKKPKASRSKASDMGAKDTEVESAPEEREDEANENVGCGEDVCLSPVSSLDADMPVADEERPKGKTSKADQLGSKDGNAGGSKIPAEKPEGKTKKSAKLPNSGTNTAQEEPVSKMKKKPSKAKSSIKASVPESTALNSAKSKKQDEDKGAVKNKKRAKVQEQVDEVQNLTPPSPEPPETPEAQRPSTVNKQPASKQHASKKPGKAKKPVKKNVLVTKELPGPELDVSAEGPSTSKRKRNPPREWWLTQHDENDTQEQQHEEVQSSQEIESKRKPRRKAPVTTDSPEQELVTEIEEIQNEPVATHKLPKEKKKKKQANKSQSNPASSRNNPKSTGRRRKPKSGAQDQREMRPALVGEDEARGDEASGHLSPVTCNQLPKQHRLTPGDKRVFDKMYTREGQSQSAQKSHPPLLEAPESVPVKRQRKPPRNWWEVSQSQDEVESLQSQQQTSSPESSRPQMGPPKSTFHKMTSLQKTLGRGQRKNKINMINTPKSVKRSLATFDAIYDSENPGVSKERGQGVRQKGRRNLLHSLEDHSEQSSENIHNDYQQQASSHASFDVAVSRVVPESSTTRRKSNPRASSGSNRASDYDIGFKSGPSSLIELERYEEQEDSDLPSSRIIPQTRFTPRVLSDCDLCGPPLKPIVLDNEDWDNLCVWFSHIWPVTSRDGKGISPDDFHWYCHAGRAMGHMVDLQNNTFSSGKILLGSYMNKPAQMDLNAVTVFNVASSCVRVEIDGVKEVYNSGQTFMAPCGQSYSIHNMCQEPAVLWYHRMLPNHTTN